MSANKIKTRDAPASPRSAAVSAASCPSHRTANLATTPRIPARLWPDHLLFKSWPYVRTITWMEAKVELPDDDITVLIALADGEVWTGFRDAGEWRFVTADLIESKVVWWAHFPNPPYAPIQKDPA